jgi:ADP-heptose:LPS heptosyltransferase
MGDSLLKKTELAIKKGINSFLFGGSPPELVSEAKPIYTSENISKILLFRQDRIGDLLVTTGFMRNLRKLMPQARIDILLSQKNYGAKHAAEPWVDDIIVYKKGLNKSIELIRELKSNKYDLVIDLFDNASTTSSALLKNLKSQYKLGFEKENLGNYTQTVPLPNKREVHIVDRIGNLLLPFGCNSRDLDMSLEYQLSDYDSRKAQALMVKKEKKRLGINLAGSSRAKFWGTKNNIEFIQKIESGVHDIEIIIFSMPDYSTELKEICSATSAVAAPKASSAHEYASLLAQCDFLLTTDTSAVHFASAFQIPLIALYTEGRDPEAPLPWTAYKTPGKSIISPNEKLSDINPEDVYVAFEEMLEVNK